jgi:hypothetical protein
VHGGRASYLSWAGDNYRVIWLVLPTATTKAIARLGSQTGWHTAWESKERRRRRRYSFGSLASYSSMYNVLLHFPLFFLPPLPAIKDHFFFSFFVSFFFSFSNAPKPKVKTSYYFHLFCLFF